MVGDVIKGYTLTTDWQVVGGMSEVAFAKKDEKEWFIKKFISPKYPMPDSPGSEKIKAQRKKKCEDFEARQKELNKRISSKCGSGGNLVYAVDFFRVDTLYYKINEKIDVSSVSIDRICRLNEKDLMIILKSLVHSLRIMHRENIVHGDLKPDNILIKATATGTYTSKLIDFDDSYFSGCPPTDRDLVVGTPEYYSPELYDYITDEDDEVSPSSLTTKSDIFALGVIFTEYITGAKPIVPDGYNGTYSAVKDGKTITFKESPHLSPGLKKLILQMLQLDASKRPDVDEVFTSLQSGTIATEPVKDPLIGKTGAVNIVSFCATPSSARKDEKIKIEWDVENAKEIRLNGFPVVKRGSKLYPVKETYTLKVVSMDGDVEERTITVVYSPTQKIQFLKAKSTFWGNVGSLSDHCRIIV